MKTPIQRALPLAALSAALLAACGGSDADAGERAADAAPPAPAASAPASLASAPTVREMVVTTSDFAFDAPATVPAGPTRVRMINRGPDIHHVWLVRLPEGRSAQDYLEEAGRTHRLPEWAVDVGGPNAAAPGAEAEATVDLEPGRYLLICHIPSPDGVIHAAKGMVRELTVTPASGPAPALGAPDATLTLRDYSFTLDRELRAGPQTILVRTEAEQPHEVALFRMAPGKTVADLLAWIEAREGPPPAEPIGGVAGLSRGEENRITVDLTPGEYAFICFLPDRGDGAPHFVHGMQRQFTVA